MHAPTLRGRITGASWMGQRSEKSSESTVAWMAIVLSAVAIVLSAIAITRPPPTPASAGADYNRIVAELQQIVEPVYADFGLLAPESTPLTVTDVLGPMLKMAAPIGGDSGGG